MPKKDYREHTQSPYDPQKTAGENFKAMLRWIFHLRSVVLSLPVAVIALILAVNNVAMLPGGLTIGAGNDVITIGRSVLIMGPLALTALSILMTLFSKKVIYPWLISIFTLLLPVVLLLTMTFGL